jgi:hypothetical protein
VFVPLWLGDVYVCVLKGIELSWYLGDVMAAVDAVMYVLARDAHCI